MSVKRRSVHTFTKLINEPVFILGADNLAAPDGTQAATITSIDAVRLERRVTDPPDETWEDTGLTFTSLQILDEGTFTDSIIAAVLTADPDASPAPGDNYMIVAECTITFAAPFGGGSTGRVFRRQAQIPASALTAPVS